MDALAGFHPAVRTWFERRFGAPDGRPGARLAGNRRRRGHPDRRAHRLRKTLAAFLVGIDRLCPQGSRAEPDGELATEVVYVSPLKALAADIQRESRAPARRDPRGRARARAGRPATSAWSPAPATRPPGPGGDAPAAAPPPRSRRPSRCTSCSPPRAAASASADVRTVIVDEIHALARDKRGSHLSLTLERLDALAKRRPQRIGLSATQRPIETVARLLVGAGEGAAARRRAGVPRSSTSAIGATSTSTIELPASELEAVASHEQWGDILDRIAAHVRAHRTTLVFVNTRRLAERVAHLLAERLGRGPGRRPPRQPVQRPPAPRRAAAQGRRPEALVATASLELGIDIGPVELVCQIGSPRSIATFLQRVGRSGHALGAVARGRLYPTRRDELVESPALLRAVRRRPARPRRSRRAPRSTSWRSRSSPSAPPTPWPEDDLFALVRRAAPYADLDRADFDEVVEMLSEGIQTGRGRRARLPPPRPRQRHPPRPAGRPPRRADLGRRHPRDGRLPRRRRPRRHVRRHRQRGLGDREHAGRRLPPRQHSWRIRRVEAGRRAGRRRPGRAAHGAVLARRGAGAHRGALGGGVRASRGGRRAAGRRRRRGRRGVARARGRRRRRVATRGRAIPRGRARRPRRPPDPAPTSSSSASSTRRAGCSSSSTRPSAGRINRALGPRAPQALLPALRLRAPGRGQRRRRRALPRPAAQLPARRRAAAS